MKVFSWDEKKNEKLRAERGISFEEVISGIERGGLRVFVVDIRDYAYLVPFMETEGEVILKTVIPSRKATRKYLRGGA